MVSIHRLLLIDLLEAHLPRVLSRCHHQQGLKTYNAAGII